ncbi:alpha/beta-hydrolase [Cystobasidium minutum MCA 4210]|uniref:alpha/beta-hydrolase n=1 Tax=Cystobasidium minutum MCA 4210 TaxID=1397322 RepID=UPI0034CDBD28|eukprot:jgi/Rhomi1/193066/gm1.1280_g
MPSKATLAVLGLATLTGVVNAQSQYGDQYWHERYHGILSMAAYGDYETLCPQTTFTENALHKSFPNSNADPWTLVEKFGPTASGFEGFTAIIPEMDKIVIVFKGMYDWLEQFGTDQVNINDIFGLNCPNCMAHAGAVQAYREAKAATNNWAKAAAAVRRTGHQWSITGHGFGGMVAQVASIDLGWNGLAHWSHSHGSPRVFNLATAQLYEKLFMGEAGQRVVANEDALPNAIPESDNYVHAMQGIHIWGNNPNYGMYMKVCHYRDDPDCEGGNKESDTWFYYTRVGTCGGAGYSNSQQVRYEHSLSAEYASATGNVTSNVTSTVVTVTSTSASAANATSTLTSALNSTVIPLISATSTAQESSTATPVTSTADSSATGGLAVNALGASSVAAPSTLQGGAASMFSLSAASMLLTALGAVVLI